MTRPEAARCSEVNAGALQMTLSSGHSGTTPPASRSAFRHLERTSAEAASPCRSLRVGRRDEAFHFTEEQARHHQKAERRSRRRAEASWGHQSPSEGAQIPFGRVKNRCDDAKIRCGDTKMRCDGLKMRCDDAKIRFDGLKIRRGAMQTSQMGMKPGRRRRKIVRGGREIRHGAMTDGRTNLKKRQTGAKEGQAGLKEGRGALEPLSEERTRLGKRGRRLAGARPSERAGLREMGARGSSPLREGWRTGLGLLR